MKSGSRFARLSSVDHMLFMTEKARPQHIGGLCVVESGRCSRCAASVARGIFDQDRARKSSPLISRVLRDVGRAARAVPGRFV